jgi:hypothetical protein
MREYEIFSSKILYIKNALPNSDNLINELERTNETIKQSDAISKWTVWNSSDGSYIFGNTKKTNSSMIVTSQTAIIDIFRKLHSAMEESFELYRNTIENNIGYFSELGISKYFTGASMGSHVDVDPGRDVFKETISGILYLNDNYSGGELNFQEQSVFIKPSSGSAVLFPSTPPFFHESKRIKSGVKYICTAFGSL